MKPIEKLKELYKNTQLSQAKFAEKFGVERHVIANILIGRQETIPDDLALALEKEYGIPFKWWKTGQGSETIEPTPDELERVTRHVESELGYFLSEEEELLLGELLATQKDLLFMLIRKVKSEPGKVKKFLLED